MIKQGQIWVDKRTGCTEYRKVIGTQLNLEEINRQLTPKQAEDISEVICLPCDKTGMISSHKKNYTKTGKLFKGRFRLC